MKPKQQRFCEEYVKDLNATQAAIRSGYSKKTATIIGFELLTKPNIQNYIKELQKDISDRNKITVDELIQRLSNIVRFDVNEILDEDGSIKTISEISEKQREAINGIEMDEIRAENVVIGHTKKLKILNKLDAIEKLMRHLGGYEKDNEQKRDLAARKITFPGGISIET